MRNSTFGRGSNPLSLWERVRVRGRDEGELIFLN